jgi:hypothetical protein
MALNLVPKNRQRGRGSKSEQLNTSVLDAAISATLDLHDAIDNGTDNCAMGWINGEILEGNQIDPHDVKEMLGSIYDEVNSIHTRLSSARQATVKSQ